MTEERAPKEKWKKKSIIAILIVLAVSTLMLGIGGSLYFTGDGYRCERYIKLAQECFESAEYEEALAYCAAALELDDTFIRAYRLASDIYLAQDECVEAVRVLMDGQAATEAEELAEREEYLRENIIVTAKTFYRYESDGSVWHWDEYEYDEAGNLTKDAWGYGGEGVKSWYEHEYDKDNNLTKTLGYDADGKIWSWSEYEYDENGSLTKEIFRNPDGSIFFWQEYQYSALGGLLKKMVYYTDGNIYADEKCQYDAKGRLTKRISYDYGGSVCFLYEYTYDKEGNLIEEMIYDGYGDVCGWHEYRYDEEGNLVQDVYHRPEGNIAYWYEYDAKGNEIKYVVCSSSSGGIAIWYEYEYDDEDHLIKRVQHHFDGDEEWHEWHELEYDARGNLTKEVRYLRDRSVDEYWEYEYDLLDSEIRQSGTDSSSAVYQYHYIGD